MRRLTLILMTVLLAVGLVSCDLSAVMQKMGENIAGANPGKINAVTDKIDETWDDKTSVDTFNDGYTLGGIKLGEIVKNSGLSVSPDTKIVAPLSGDDFQELAASIGVASSTSQGSAALTKQLSKPLDTTEDSEKIAATKGTAEVFKGILIQMAGEGITASTPDLRKALKEAMNVDGETGSEEAEVMQTLLGMAIDGIFDVAEGETEDGEKYTPTQGDLLFMQSLFTVVNEIGPQVFEPTADDPFAMREDLMDDKTALNEIIDQANAGLQVIDAVAPASAFKGMDISSVLNSLMEGMENSESEGGSN